MLGLGESQAQFVSFHSDMIRYHSLYPWHTGGAYTELENDKDRETKKAVLRFNKWVVRGCPRNAWARSVD